MPRLLHLSLVLLLASFAFPAASAILIVENGQLMGARNVLVQSQLYDVTFVDGTCADLFSNCDEESDFVFSWTDPEQALAARAALLDQVFLGEFDSQPERTNGCSSEAYCSVSFPIQKLGSPEGVGVAITTNYEDEAQDNATSQGGGSRTHDTTNVPYQTYAVWSGPLAPAAVPISPLVGVLVSAGLVATSRRGFSCAPPP